MNIDAIVKHDGGLINLAVFDRAENAELARVESQVYNLCGPIYYDDKWEKHCFSFYPK